MVKLVLPKRSDKKLTAQQYWSIRQHLSTTKSKTIITPKYYLQQQVANRNRYTKPTLQAQKFNPLQILSSSIQQSEETFTQQYLQSIHFQLPSCLANIKSMMFTLPLIIYRLRDIFEGLIENLHCIESWKLLQAIIKDTKHECQHLFATNFNKFLPCCLGFNKVQFTRFFDLWCIFMRTCFPTSSQKMVFHLKLAIDHTLTHQNKYLRKFSYACLSYLCKNVNQQIWLKTLQSLQLIQNIQPDIIGNIMLQRAVISFGCLTSNAFETFINQINLIFQIFFKELISFHRVYEQFNQYTRIQI